MKTGCDEHREGKKPDGCSISHSRFQSLRIVRSRVDPASARAHASGERPENFRGSWRGNIFDVRNSTENQFQSRQAAEADRLAACAPQNYRIRARETRAVRAGAAGVA